MKKIVVLFLIFCSTFCYAQERWMEGEFSLLVYTVITKEQFESALRRCEEGKGYAVFEFVDAATIAGLRVSSGRRPNFRGYYYLSITNIMISMGTRLAYGNSNTGRVEIWFKDSPEAPFGYSSVRVGSNEYNRQKNMHWRWVNGE
jgi:hypothetical protein